MADARFAHVTVVGRREIHYQGPNKEKLLQQVVDFENLEASRSVFKGHQVAFCSLGTTRADAGSAEKFIRIDHDYVVNAAKLIEEENRANVNSSLMFPRSKGQTEKDLSDLNFSRFTIIRPGVLELEQKREGSTRYAESAFLATLPVVKLFAPTFSTPVGTVAKALIAAATDPAKWHGADKVRIFDSKILDAMAEAAAPA
ncbi:Oxidoreductase htatip2 [Allomyces arbusculus]|nr:Oxidoreductase htatip2 [Allomyces arbusculus]